MDAKELQRVMAAAVGDPESGPVSEALPVLAAAVAAALNPGSAEKRVVKAAETR